MKKIIFIFAILLVLFTSAASVMAAPICDESVRRGDNGIVPCGRGQCIVPEVCVDPNTGAETGCNEPGAVLQVGACDAQFNTLCRCELGHVFILILNIYNFFVWRIATPLAGLMIVIGGLIILLSGGPGGKNPVTGNITPNLYNRGKDMVVWSIASVILLFGSWFIVDIFLRAIGYGGAWSGF